MGIIEELAKFRYQEGFEKGYQEALKIRLNKAVKEIMNAAKEERVRILLAKRDFSLETIADLVGVSISFVKRVQKELLAK